MVATGSAKAPVIWLISDGSPGHFNQSLAVAEALQRAGHGDIVWLEARQRIRGFLRPLFAWLIEHSRGPLPRTLQFLLYLFPQGMPAGRPSLILSSGGKTAFLNVLLARHFDCANVFIGPPPDVSPRHFHAVLHAEQAVHGANCIAMDYLPTRLDPEKACQAGSVFIAEHGLKDRRLCCMLIGGDSRSHHYSAEDWQALARGMNELARMHRFSWLVTTSRRTGREAEAILREHLDPQLLADATWWEEQPRDVVIPYLGAAQAVFCTQDSLSMLSEAIAAGRPVFAIHPEAVRHDIMESSFNERFLATNGRMARLVQVPVKALASCNLALEELDRQFRPVTDDIMRGTIDTLLGRLGRP